MRSSILTVCALGLFSAQATAEPPADKPLPPALTAALKTCKLRRIEVFKIVGSAGIELTITEIRLVRNELWVATQEKNDGQAKAAIAVKRSAEIWLVAPDWKIRHHDSIAQRNSKLHDEFLDGSIWLATDAAIPRH